MTQMDISIYETVRGLENKLRVTKGERWKG